MLMKQHAVICEFLAYFSVFLRKPLYQQFSTKRSQDEPNLAGHALFVIGDSKIPLLREGPRAACKKGKIKVCEISPLNTVISVEFTQFYS